MALWYYILYPTSHQYHSEVHPFLLFFPIAALIILWGINFCLFFCGSFYFRIHLTLFTFQVLAYILSTVDDTKLLTKVGSSSDVCHELFFIINGVAFYWKFLIKFSLHRLSFVSFKQFWKSLFWIRFLLFLFFYIMLAYNLKQRLI